jgi:hypothetical protein
MKVITFDRPLISLLLIAATKRKNLAVNNCYFVIFNFIFQPILATFQTSARLVVAEV